MKRYMDLTKRRGALALRIGAGAVAALAGLWLAGSGDSPLGGAAWAQGAVTAKHGLWETRCETPPGASAQQCAIVQSVVDDDRPNITLVVIALKTADRKSRLLRVITPLGVLLPTGLSLRVDKVDLGRMNFVRCLPNGCVAEVFLDDKLLGKLESGSQATFVLFETPEEGVGVPTPLAGFKDGFEALP
jgi:invasion protein IalB